MWSPLKLIIRLLAVTVILPVFAAYFLAVCLLAVLDRLLREGQDQTMNNIADAVYPPFAWLFAFFGDDHG